MITELSSPDDDFNPMLDEDDDHGPAASKAPRLQKVSTPRFKLSEVETPNLDDQFMDLMDDEEGAPSTPPASAPQRVAPTPQRANRQKQGQSLGEKPRKQPVSPAVTKAASTAKSAAKRKRRLLNKHDYAVLLFLAKADYCTTRQLALALGRVGEEDALRRKLKGLEVSGYAAAYKRTGGKDLWMATAKAIAKLRKQGIISAESRLKSRDPNSITGGKIGHTLAVAQVMAKVASGHSDGAAAILTEREIRSHHMAMKAEAQRLFPGLFESDTQHAVYKLYRDREDLVLREDLSPALAERLGSYSFEAEQSPEEFFPELFRPMTLNTRREAYGQSPDFVVVDHRDEAGQPPPSVAYEVELHTKSREEYVNILNAYKKSVLIGRVVFVIRFEEKRTYNLKGEVKEKERLEDRINEAAFKTGMEDCVEIDYITTQSGDYFAGDPWGL